MSESSGAGYLDRLLQGGAGAIQVESNGVALPAPVDKINLLGGSVVATYEPPAGGEKYGTAVVNLDDVTFTAGDPVAIVVGSAGDTGSGDSVALANHLHPCTRGTPSDIGTTNEAGTSADFAGADHIHALPFSAVHSALAGATGSVSLNGQVLTQIGAPTDPTAATNKAYVDASRQGLAPHPVIDGVLTANFALTGLDKTSSDGVVLSNPNMRVLATAQLTSTGNGLYLTGSGAWTLASDMAVGIAAAGAYFMVRTVGTGWYCTNTSGFDVVGTNTLHFAQLSGATEITVAAPLTKTGTEIDLSPATDSAAGSMSAADKTKLDAISGTAGKVAVFTSGGLGNSSITDNGSLVTVAEPVSVNAASATPALTINGTSGNTSIVLSDAGGSFYSSWDIHANSLSTTGGIRGALVFANQSDPTHPRFWMDYTGFTGWGGITDPSAYVDTPTLRVRTGAAAGFIAQSDASGNLTWRDRTMVVNSEGTHQQHSKHFEGVVPYNTTRSFGFTESVWKGNVLAPTGDTGVRGCSDASITVRVIGRDSNATGQAFDWTYRGTILRIYDVGAGGSWAVSVDLTALTGMCSGSNSTVSVAFGLSGTANGTITITVYNISSSGIPADCAVIVDIIGAGNYAS